MKKQDGNGAAPEGALNAFLDQGSSFEGKLTFKGTVRIDGEFKGDIMSKDTLMIGETGRVEGTIEVGEAIVSGQVQGTIRASRRLQLRPTARIQGELQVTALMVEEGARLDGRVGMGADQHETARLHDAVRQTLDQKPGH